MKSDQASNMVAALVELEHSTCLAHALQLVVKVAVDHRATKALIKKFKHLVAMFGRSHTMRMALKKIQNQLKMPERAPPKVSVTRWNALYDAMEWVLEQKEVLEEFADDPDAQNACDNAVLPEDSPKFAACQLDDADFTQLQHLAALLMPLKTLTDVLQRSKTVTASLALPMLSKIINMYRPSVRSFSAHNNTGEVELSAPMLEVKKDVHADMKKRFVDKLDPAVIEDMHIATQLDPRLCVGAAMQ
jgi:hypothetical protein